MMGYGQYHAPQTDLRRSRGPLVLLVGAIALLVLAAVQYGQHSMRAASPAENREVTPRGDLTATEQATIELFERCSKSVVYVSPSVRRREFTIFGVRDRIERGTGSGFVWDNDGHIVTNFHVIYGADEYHVTLYDNSTYDATVVGYLADKDVAVLRIDAPSEKLQPIDVGTSRGLKVGQNVLAIGNPYGLDFTLTTGVVSALNREIEALNRRTIHGVIQTDAAINPGNSGGPLLDSAGRLIGMNTSILSRSGSSAGIGFAVPVDTINDVVSQLITYGRVIRPGLGIQPDDRLAMRLGLEGVLFRRVTRGSGADRAGLQPTTITRTGRIRLGDVILKIGETPTPDTDALLNALENYEIGDKVDVTVRRDGKNVTIPVTLQAIE